MAEVINKTYLTAFKQLNAAQKIAVTTTEGALLVLAGPGTGKTQLLSTRAAYIVQNGVVSASNILCLTYTDAGAIEMRNRMGDIMGAEGGNIAVHTFHGFGSWLIREYPDQFSVLRSQTLLDELSRHHVFESLLGKLPLRHAFAIKGEKGEFSRQAAVQNAIKAFKQGGLSPAELRANLKANQSQYGKLDPLWNDIFGTTLSAKSLPTIAEAVNQPLAKAEPGSYTDILLSELSQIIDNCTSAGVTAELGRWRGKHIERQNGKHTLKSSVRSKDLNDLVDLYEQYQAHLSESGRFDYEDMVLRAITVLEANSDIVLDIAEKFQYIMVDEFQDTSGAQNRLLGTLLKAHPTDSPNILAVGDDDQAIMRFQGAELSGMVDFVKRYQPKVIVLTENYRSGQAILNAAEQIISQTDERLVVELPGLKLTKTLVAARDAELPTTLTHNRYVSPSAQYQAVAEHIKQLQEQEVPSKEIAVISSKHKELEALSPFLEAAGVHVSYDRRETVLDEPHVAQLLDLARFVSIAASNIKVAETHLPKVLAGNYWGLPLLATYDIAVAARLNKTSWLDTMLHSENDSWRDIAEWLLAASELSKYNNFTQMFDILLGRAEVPDSELKYSPYRDYIKREPTEQYVRLLSHLIRLRSVVLEARPSAKGIADLVEICDDYKASGIRIVDDNPVLRGANDSVQLMSAHGAKGREFKHVILLSTVESIWGPKAPGNNSNIPLPENLQLYPAGNSPTDKLRLLYVAITRAKTNLYIVSYSQKDDGRAVETLSFLNLGDEADAWWQPHDVVAPNLDQASHILENAWHPEIKNLSSRTLQELLQPIVPHLRLSPSVLNSFLNLKYAGPAVCLEEQVLKFPSAYNEHSALGSATHKILQTAQLAYKNGSPLTDAQLREQFSIELDNAGLSEAQLQSVRLHGQQFIPVSVSLLATNDFAAITATEQYLSTQLPGNLVPISGQLDAVQSSDNSLNIIDYKTGKAPEDGWNEAGQSDATKLKLHFYRRQLLFYKLLVDNSIQYKGKNVTSAELIFVEPVEKDGKQALSRLRIDSFDAKELAYTARLIHAAYRALISGDLPDISTYSPTLKGVLAFETNLLDI